MRNTTCNSIIIEGLDSLGKSLQTRRLVTHLQQAGFRVTHVKSPYDDGFSFRLIYWMLGNGLARKVPNLFQLVHFFNKLLFQFFVLPKMLEKNDFIVFDRWSISMWAYGVMDGADSFLTSWMLYYIAEPDFTIILDGSRHGRDRADDSYESDVEYQKRVRIMYIDWALNHSNVALVNANQPIEDVSRDILVNMQRKGFSV